MSFPAGAWRSRGTRSSHPTPACSTVAVIALRIHRDGWSLSRRVESAIEEGRWAKVRGSMVHGAVQLPATSEEVMSSFRVPAGEGAANLIRAETPEALPAALARARIPAPGPVVVLVGGAAGLDDGRLRRLIPVFAVGLVPAIERAGAVAVDGGTDAGVMRLLGEARSANSAAFRLVGVAAEGTVRVPGRGAQPRRRRGARASPHRLRPRSGGRLGRGGVLDRDGSRLPRRPSTVRDGPRQRGRHRVPRCSVQSRRRPAGHRDRRIGQGRGRDRRGDPGGASGSTGAGKSRPRVSSVVWTRISRPWCARRCPRL